MAAAILFVSAFFFLHTTVDGCSTKTFVLNHCKYVGIGSTVALYGFKDFFVTFNSQLRNIHHQFWQRRRSYLFFSYVIG